MIYFDIDGVLAKFLFGTSQESIYREGYFNSLPVQENMLEVAKILANESYIISAYLEDHPTIIREKKNWLKTYIPEIPEDRWIFVPCGTNKSIYMREKGDILIDDLGKNCKMWENAGGKAIKVSKDEFDREIELKKYKIAISPYQSKEKILNVIENLKNS